MSEHWVVVTGATGGIGAAVCRRAAEAGLKPVVGYHRRADEARALALALGGLALELDLTRPETLADAIADLGERTVTGLVLNAALPPEMIGWTEAQSDQFASHWQVGVVGNHALLTALYRHSFKPRRRGAVVAVLTSALGEGGRPAPKMAPYVVGKAGLQALLRTLGAEARWLNIETVSPGYTDTPMLEVFEPRMVELLREQGQISDPQVVAADIVERLLAAGAGTT